MLALIEPMLRDYERALNPHVAADATLTTTLTRMLADLGKKWAGRFGAEAYRITTQMIDRNNNFSKKSLTASLKEMSGGLTIPTPDMPAALYDRLLASTKTNVGLIKSIPAEYHQRIQQAVLRSISAGNFGSHTLREELEKISGVTRERADLIAVDQTRKVNTAMNEERMDAAGLEEFEWIHSGGGKHPRPLHVEYDGRIFKLKDPPVIDERTGEKGLPGQLINCRCKMRPILNFKKYLS